MLLVLQHLMGGVGVVRPYGGSFHPAERFTRREVDRVPETRKNFAFYLHMNLESKGLHVTL